MKYGESTSAEVERVAREIVDAAFKVHQALGPGILESVYETCLAYELGKRRLKVLRQLMVPIVYDGQQLDDGLRLDLMVEDCIVVEVKAVEKMLPLFEAQVLTYLELTGKKLALLINEDSGLIFPPRISGPLHGTGAGQGLIRARDERDLFFRAHPTQTDRDYLLVVFDDLAQLPGTRDVFGTHNPVSTYRDWLSGDAAQKLIEFFQKIDADGTGEIAHDFTDDQWDPRFLGDLYQDLSEAARKKYALLQTPVFVEEFILERTLEPAIREFGLKDFKMIDPACGSGHFPRSTCWPRVAVNFTTRWRR